MRQYPHARLIRWDASIVVAAWALLALSVTAIFLVGLFRKSDMAWAISALLVALGVAAMHFVLALIHKCPVCSKRPMVEGFTPLHPDSVSQARLSGWAGVAWNVYRHRRFICIHCGTAFACDK